MTHCEQGFIGNDPLFQLQNGNFLLPLSSPAFTAGLNRPSVSQQQSVPITLFNHRKCCELTISKPAVQRVQVKVLYLADRH